MQEIIGGVLIGIIGLLMLISPKTVFVATERWKSHNRKAEMNRAYEIVLRVLGLVFTAIGLVIIF